MLKAGLAGLFQMPYILYTMYKMRYILRLPAHAGRAAPQRQAGRPARTDRKAPDEPSFSGALEMDIFMNLNVLRYALEVEKSRSITGAAKQLFISQPNLSRDIRELEEEIGFSIFARSSRGVVPTERGREFLQLAKKAVRQYQALEHFCAREEHAGLSLQVCVPKAGYVHAAFVSFLARQAKGRTLCVDYREAGTMDAIRSVCARSAGLAIIRFPDRHERSLLSLLKRKELSGEILCRFELTAVMSERHPLAATSVLTADMLEQSVQLLCEDTSLSEYLNEPTEPEPFPSCIRLQEGSGLCSLLSHLPGAFSFLPPLPESMLKEYHLVQKRCQGPPRKMSDMLLLPEEARLSRAESAFLEAVRQAAPGSQSTPV